MSSRVYTIVVFLALNIQSLSANSMHHVSTGIIIHHPWVRLAPVNAPVLGAFMQIQNNTHNAIKLISADAKGFERAELHRTTNHNGIMKMQKQDFIPISKQGKLELQPGGWHMMLISPNVVPKEKEMVLISLKFDNGTVQTIRAVVRKSKMTINDNHLTH